MNLKIGTTIKKLRTKNKVTQDQLATFLGCTPQAISRWESETSYPDIELLPSIAEFFSVSTLYNRSSSVNFYICTHSAKLTYIFKSVIPNIFSNNSRTL